MAKVEDCKYIIDGINLDPEVTSDFYKQVTNELMAAGYNDHDFTKFELKAIIESFADGFADRQKRMRYSRAIIRSNRNRMKAELKRDPIEFIKMLPRNIEIERDVIEMAGRTMMVEKMETMSDGGAKFKNGELDEEIYKYAVEKDRNPLAKHENKDVEIGYQLMVDFDKWDYEIQLMSGVTVEKLKGHLLKYSNLRPYVAETSPEKWIADQKKFRNLRETYGIRATDEEITQKLSDEYYRIVDRSGKNTSRPSRLMYRGVVMEPGAVIMHNKLYGHGSIHASMEATLQKTSSNSALQSVIPVERVFQRGLDVKNPQGLIDKVTASDWDDMDKAQAIIMLEERAKDESSVHLKRVWEDIGDHIEQLTDEYNALSKLESPDKKDKARMKQLDKEIVFLRDKGSELELRINLDEFIGREPSKVEMAGLKETVTDVINLTTKGLTVPLLGRSWIAAWFDAIPAYARNMELYGSGIRNIPGNIFRSLQKVAYTMGSSWSKSAKARAEIINRELGLMLTNKQIFEDTIGMKDALESYRSGEKQYSPMRLLHRLANGSFFITGVQQMNVSSMNGAWNMEKLALYKALTEKVPTQNAIDMFANYGLSEFDILSLRQSIINNNGIFDLGMLRETNPILHHRLRVAMTKNAFMTTPRAEWKTDRMMDRFKIFGKTPLKRDSKLSHAIKGMQRALQRTGLTAVMNTFEMIGRNKNLAIPENRKEVLNRISQVMLYGMVINGSIAVLRAGVKPEGEDVKGPFEDPEEFTRVFLSGMLSFEFLGLYRDLVYNFLSGNHYALSENVLGPVGSKLMVAGKNIAKVPVNLMDIWAEVDDAEEQKIVSTREKYSTIKRSNVLFNIPFLEAYTDKYIVEQILSVFDEDAVEEYKENRDENMIERQERFEDAESIKEYYKALRNVD
jgi:hypothetical protein